MDNTVKCVICKKIFGGEANILGDPGAVSGGGKK